MHDTLLPDIQCTIHVPIDKVMTVPQQVLRLGSFRNNQDGNHVEQIHPPSKFLRGQICQRRLW
jgi:hypothetical protein